MKILNFDTFYLSTTGRILAAAILDAPYRLRKRHRDLPRLPSQAIAVLPNCLATLYIRYRTCMCPVVTARRFSLLHSRDRFVSRGAVGQQVRGDLQPPVDQVLPPFERWAFRRQHYIQYMVDQYTLHHAIEEATMLALQPATEGSESGPSASPAVTPLLLTSTSSYLRPVSELLTSDRYLSSWQWKRHTDSTHGT